MKYACSVKLIRMESARRVRILMSFVAFSFALIPLKRSRLISSLEYLRSSHSRTVNSKPLKEAKGKLIRYIYQKIHRNLKTINKMKR